MNPVYMAIKLICGCNQIILYLFDSPICWSSLRFLPVKRRSFFLCKTGEMVVPRDERKASLWLQSGSDSLRLVIVTNVRKISSKTFRTLCAATKR